MGTPGQQDSGNSPTPEEIKARAWAVRFWWSDDKERHRRTGSALKKPYEAPQVTPVTKLDQRLE